MTRSVVVVSQSGTITTGLTTLLAARENVQLTQLVTDRPEHARYYLSPATLAELDDRLAGDDASLVVIDGDPHSGQLNDLQQRLSGVTLRDRRSAIWEQLAEDNPTAATRLELWQQRITRRAIVATDRTSQTDSPTGTGNQQQTVDQQIDACREALEQHQQQAREHIGSSYTGVDAHVLLIGRPTAPTSRLWAALTNNTAPERADRPAQPQIATATVGPHTVAVTDFLGIPGEEGCPAWLQTVLPGVTAVLDRADLVVGVGMAAAPLLADIENTPTAVLAQPTAGALTELLSETLQTETHHLQLPYTDAAHRVVAQLHDTAEVQAIDYGTQIDLRVEVPATKTASLRQEVASIDGAIIADTEQAKQSDNRTAHHQTDTDGS